MDLTSNVTLIWALPNELTWNNDSELKSTHDCHEFDFIIKSIIGRIDYEYLLVISFDITNFDF